MTTTLKTDIIELDRALKASSSTDASMKMISVMVEAYLDSVRDVSPCNLDLDMAGDLFLEMAKLFDCVDVDALDKERAAFVKYQSVCIQIGTLLRAETKLYKRS